MRIGIDLDDTLVDTVKTVKRIIEENNCNLETANYRKWKTVDKQNFFDKFGEATFLNGVINDGAIDVINKLKSDGHELWIVTARNNAFCKKGIEYSKQFLKNNNINVDKDYFSVSPKGKFCADNNIDILIDDSTYQCNSVLESGKKAILFDSEFNQECNIPRALNWEEVYRLIKQMEG